jgi:hypothetical protein
MAVTSSPSPATDRDGAAPGNPFAWFLTRALIAGALAGIAGALFLWVAGEPVIRRALDVEAERSHGDESEHVEMFTRGVQVVGGMLAAVLYGVLLAVVFGLVFMAVRHRTALATDFQRAVALAGCAFAALGLIPALKYPANPPAVGDPETVGQRTVLYLILLAIGVLVIYTAWRGARALRAAGWPQHRRVPLVAGAVAAALALTYAVLPASPDVVPDDVPADLLWRFRVMSLAGLAIMWGTLGLTFGWLCMIRRRWVTFGR